MATDDDMRERIQSLETKFDGLERKIDQLPTKADLSGFATKDDLTRFATKDDLLRFATKDDLVAFKDEIIKNFRILANDAKESATKAAEGHQATLDRIERDLGEMNKRMGEKFSDHAKILANHNDR